jgi:hypothetical protein
MKFLIFKASCEFYGAVRGTLQLLRWTQNLTSKDVSHLSSCQLLCHTRWKIYSSTWIRLKTLTESSESPWDPAIGLIKMQTIAWFYDISCFDCKFFTVRREKCPQINGKSFASKWTHLRAKCDALMWRRHAGLRQSSFTESRIWLCSIKIFSSPGIAF